MKVQLPGRITRSGIVSLDVASLEHLRDLLAEEGGVIFFTEYDMSIVAQDDPDDSWLEHSGVVLDENGKELKLPAPDDEVDIEAELERLQGICERLSLKMKEEGNRDASMYHNMLGQLIEQAVRYTKG